MDLGRFDAEPLTTWLKRLELGSEDALTEGDDDTLLGILGILDRLAYGDTGLLSEEDRAKVVESIAAIKVASGSDAHEEAFFGVQLRGVVNLEEHEIIERLRAAIRAELEERWNLATA